MNLTVWVDALIEAGLTVVAWLATRLYPYLRSKTGYDNPRVRHITSLTYPLRDSYSCSPVPHSINRSS